MLSLLKLHIIKVTNNNNNNSCWYLYLALARPPQPIEARLCPGQGRFTRRLGRARGGHTHNIDNVYYIHSEAAKSLGTAVVRLTTDLQTKRVFRCPHHQSSSITIYITYFLHQIIISLSSSPQSSNIHTRHPVKSVI